jgi:hypothetical protein
MRQKPHQTMGKSPMMALIRLSAGDLPAAL